ncbi:MAG: molybdenum cofactor guanylyltransferase [Aureispira sp.]
MIEKEAITAVILAGGQSRRMGQNKALLRLGGQSFLERVVAAASPLVTAVALVDNGTVAAHYKGVSWSDRYLGQGPVAGIETALWHIKTPYALILSCDLPVLSTAVLGHLLAHSNAQKSTIFSLEGRWQPLIGVYAQTQQAIFEQALQQQQLRLMDVLQELPVEVCPCPKQWATHLSNVNTLEAYQRLQHDFEH